MTDNWKNRIDTASKHLGIESVELEKTLEDLGITEETPDCLEILSDPDIKLFGSLKSKFSTTKDIPLRLAVKALSGGFKKETSDRLKTLSSELGLSSDSFNITNVDTDVLLKNYKNPSNLQDPVTAELKRRFGDKKIILFKDSKVAIEETIDYAVSLEKGAIASSFVKVDGEPVEPIAVGELPDQLLDEDPMFPGFVLWADKSRKNNVDYSDIPVPVRQFIRILVERREIDPSKRMEISMVLGTIRASCLDSNNGDDKISAVKDMFPETYIEFKKRQKDDTLPKLKTRQNVVKPNNPFGNRSY